MPRRTQTGYPLLPPCRPTATQQPYLVQVPGLLDGRRVGRAWCAGSLGWAVLDPTELCWWARGAAKSAPGNEVAQTGLRPPKNKQVFSGCREPRPSPLLSAGLLPLPSPGVGRCAWHIPHILPPVSSVLPPLPCSALWSCWRNQGCVSTGLAWSKLQKVLPP